MKTQCNTWLATPELAKELAECQANFNTENMEGLEEARLKARAYRPSIKDGVAIIPIKNVITQNFNWMTWLYDGTACSDIKRTIEWCEENEEVKSVLFDICSGGGEASGVEQTAIAIANMKKPTVAYVDGMMASAAYWLGSACKKVVASRTSEIGSIGVVITLIDDTKAYEKAGFKKVELVSKNAPYKRPDIKTQEGQDEFQMRIDNLETLFIEYVSNYRGVTPETVTQDFGKGRVLIADDAVSRNMIDATGSLSDLWAESISHSEGNMEISIEAIKTEHADIAETLKAEGVKAEQERIQSIEALAGLDCASEVIAKVKFDGKTTAEQASKMILEAQLASKQSAMEAITADAEETPEATASTSSAVDETAKAIAEGKEAAKTYNGGKE